MIFTNGDLTRSCTFRVPDGPLCVMRAVHGPRLVKMFSSWKQGCVLLESSLTLNHFFFFGNIENSRFPLRSVSHFEGLGELKRTHDSDFEMLITCTKGELLNEKEKEKKG